MDWRDFGTPRHRRRQQPVSDVTPGSPSKELIRLAAADLHRSRVAKTNQAASYQAIVSPSSPPITPASILRAPIAQPTDVEPKSSPLRKSHPSINEPLFLPDSSVEDDPMTPPSSPEKQHEIESPGDSPQFGPQSSPFDALPADASQMSFSAAYHAQTNSQAPPSAATPRIYPSQTSSHAPDDAPIPPFALPPAVEQIVTSAAQLPVAQLAATTSIRSASPAAPPNPASQDILPAQTCPAPTTTLHAKLARSGSEVSLTNSEVAALLGNSARRQVSTGERISARRAGNTPQAMLGDGEDFSTTFLATNELGLDLGQVDRRQSSPAHQRAEHQALLGHSLLSPTSEQVITPTPELEESSHDIDDLLRDVRDGGQDDDLMLEVGSGKIINAYSDTLALMEFLAS